MSTYAWNSDWKTKKIELKRALSVFILSIAGVGLLYMVGFGQGPQNFMHNAAHDTRHAFTFPCH